MTQEARVREFVTAFEGLRAEVEKVIVGHREIINHVLIGMFAGGHVLLEGVPGLGKTLLVKTLAEALDLQFSRIQFTPDLMPADIIGTNIIVEDADGPEALPVPARARSSPTSCWRTRSTAPRPKTQSALLEAMQEAHGHRGRRVAAAAGAVLRARHAEPDRDGGHVSAARGAARPLPASSCASAIRRSRS